MRREDKRTELRSYGRRRTRRLTERQQSLFDRVGPAVACVAGESQLSPRFRAALARGACRTWLEIGFGGGENLIAQAKSNPQVTVVGCEPFVDGCVKAYDALEASGVENVFIHNDDARALLDLMPAASLARVFVLFPDPWPKRRHAKRRLVGPSLLDRLARVMTPGGELRVATDCADYARTILLAVHHHADFVWTAQRAADWTVPPQDWIPTRYEMKATREGRSSCYFSIMRRPCGS
ncbi:MAG: tRNA (guanosine(46)-N7)-methyltransferase TrmB [Hyphomicrobiaceae bacterium]